MTTKRDGVIKKVPVLDLSYAKEPADLAHLKEVRKVGVLIVPKPLAHVLAGVEMDAVANVVHVDEGAHVRVHTGMYTIGGDGLASPESDNEVLVVTGTMVVTSPVEHVGFRGIHVTGMVLAPKGSESALGAGLTSITGSVVYYRWSEGQEFRNLVGNVRLGGETLANAGGSADDVLLVAGELIVTSKVVDIGYQLIGLGGELLAPKQSEPALTRVLQAAGTVVWYDGDPRFLVGDETYGRAFFEYLDGQQELAFVGKVTIADDGVTAELLREKVSGITLLGSLTAPAEVVPALQVLTKDKSGPITVNRDGAEDN